MSSLPIKCLHLNYLNILFVKNVCFISYHLEYVSYFMCKIMSISKWGLENKKMWSVWYSIPSDNLRQQKRKYVFFPSVENLSKFDVSSRRRLFLNCLGEIKIVSPPIYCTLWSQYIIVTKGTICDYNVQYCDNLDFSQGGLETTSSYYWCPHQEKTENRLWAKNFVSQASIDSIAST